MRRMAGPHQRFVSCVLALLVASVAPRASAAPKTDVVMLLNGDRYTGEVKGLERGQLEFKTDAAGTLFIEWDKIASLKTDQYVQVEFENGLRLSGVALDETIRLLQQLAVDECRRGGKQAEETLGAGGFVDRAAQQIDFLCGHADFGHALRSGTVNPRVSRHVRTGCRSRGRCWRRDFFRQRRGAQQSNGTKQNQVTHRILR